MQRYNFQFTGQRFFRIEGGRLAGQVRDVAYQATTTEFWGSMEAVGGRSTYLLGGAFNCGKGQPGQVAPVSPRLPVGAGARRPGPQHPRGVGPMSAGPRDPTGLRPAQDVVEGALAAAERGATTAWSSWRRPARSRCASPTTPPPPTASRRDRRVTVISLRQVEGGMAVGRRPTRRRRRRGRAGPGRRTGRRGARRRPRTSAHCSTDELGARPAGSAAGSIRAPGVTDLSVLSGVFGRPVRGVRPGPPCRARAGRLRRAPARPPTYLGHLDRHPPAPTPSRQGALHLVARSAGRGQVDLGRRRHHRLRRRLGRGPRGPPGRAAGLGVPADRPARPVATRCSCRPRRSPT